MKKLIFATALALAALASPALAANCSAYTYTLTNGQVADATQVMSNFNTILACGNNNLAKNGANSDITSLSGLTTPLSTGQGGTGQATSIFSSNNTWAGTQALNGVVTFGAVGNLFTAGTTAAAPINIPQGVAPTAPVNGDIWTTSSGVYARINGVTGLVSYPQIVQVRYQTATGVNSAETFSAVGAWNTRTLGTVVVNNVSGASLASNKVTLPAGTYSYQVFTTLYSVGGVAYYKSRLYNVTDSSVVAYSLAGSSNESATNAPFQGQFTLAAAKDIRLDTYTTGVGAGAGGHATGDGSVEIYTDIVFQKIG